MEKVYLISIKNIENGDDDFKSPEFKTPDEAKEYANVRFKHFYIDSVIPHRDLFFKDVMARIPYGVKFRFELEQNSFETIVFNQDEELPHLDELYAYWMRQGFILPYLRPLSSMNDDETAELFQLMGGGNDIQRMDFYLAHHFDCRDFIGKGLAVEAPEGMYEF
jgi:hypothetical protein